MNRPRIWLVVPAALLLAAGCAHRSPRVTVSRPESVSPTSSALRRKLPRNMPRRSAENLPELTKESPISDYLAYAAVNSPALRSAFRQWKAALEKIPQAEALPDPRLSIGYLAQEIETRAGPQEWRVGLKQTFPWFGRLDLKGDMAGEAARAAWQRFRAQKLDLFYRVKKAYAEYFYLSRAISITRKHRDLMKYLEKVARTKYRTGIAPHAAVIKAQVEVGKLEDRLASLRDLKDARAAKLNAALGRRADAPLPWPVQLSGDRIKTGSTELVKELQQSNPELKALDRQIDRARSAVDLAQLRYYPDITAGLTYMETGSAVMPGVGDSGKDPVLASLSINLPIWWNSYRAGERQAGARLRRAKRKLEDRRKKLEADLELALYGVNDARRKMNLYGNSLIPQAEQSLEATRSAFKAGDADVQSLLDAERLLLEFRLERERALADHLKSAAKLEKLVGRRPGTEERSGRGTTQTDGKRNKSEN